MPEAPLRVTLVQSDWPWEDPVASLEQHERMLAEIAPGDTDLVVLPEMFPSGFTMDPERVAEPPSGPSREWLRRTARRLDAAVTGSVATRDADGIYNRLLWSQPDGVVRSYDKRHLFRMAGEHERYRPGTRPLVIDWRGWRVRPLICYDLRFPVWSRAVDDTDLMLCVANWPAARRTAWQRLLPARAIENLCAVAGVNRVGEDGNGVRYSGDSVLLDWRGDPILELDDRPGCATATIDGSALARFRERFPAHLDADAFELRPDPATP